MPLKRLENAQVTGKRVLVSFDCESALDSKGELINPAPLALLLPSLNYLLERGARPVLFSQFQNYSPYQTAVSLRPLGQALEAMLGKEVCFIEELILGDKRRDNLLEQSKGDFVLLENLATYPNLKTEPRKTAHALSQIGDIYVNEARGWNQTENSCLVELPTVLASYVGLSLFKLLEFCTSIRVKHKQDLYFVLGGIKLENKLRLLHKFMPYLDGVLIGGSLAYSFLHSRAVPTGISLREQSLEVSTFQTLERAELEQVQTILPIDHCIANQPVAEANSKYSAGIPDAWYGVDIGPKTLSQFEKVLQKASTIVWYGPLGLSEIDKYCRSTQSFSRFLAKSKAHICIMGQETTKLACSMQKETSYDHVEADGEFCVELFVDQNSLPGLLALDKS